jgi:serine/threonine protein kinase
MAYCSPEILLSGIHSHQTDIWSLGVVLHVLLSGNFPFLHPDKNQTKLNIVAGRVIFYRQMWEQVSREAREIVIKILTPNLF